jgi:hypothetical protein
VHDGDNDNRIDLDAVENPEGKATEDCATSLPVHDWVCFGVLGNAVERIKHLFEEVVPEARALSLVPCACLLDVIPRLRAYINSSAHNRLRMSAITSEAGCPRSASAA